MDNIKERLKRKRFLYFLFYTIMMLSALVIGVTILLLVLKWICRNYTVFAVIFDYPYNIITYAVPVFLIASFFAWLYFDNFNGLDDEPSVQGKDGELVVLNKNKLP